MVMTSSNRIWIIGSMLAIVAIAALGWLLGINPQLEAARVADGDRSEVEAQNQVLQLDLVALKEQYEDFDEYRAELDALQAEIPQTLSFAQFLDKVQAAAVTSGVTVSAISTEAPSLFAPAEGSIAAELGGDVSNVAYVPVSITVLGARANVLAFVQSFQSGNARLTLITDVNLAIENGLDLAQYSGGFFVAFDPDAAVGDSLLLLKEQVAGAAADEGTTDETAEPTPTPTP